MMEENKDRGGCGLKERKQVLAKLFVSTLYLSAFTFGGGYVIVTLMKQKFVDTYHWIEEDEMLDLVAIAQSAPGAIAVNGAIVVGYQLAGIPGVLVSVLGTVLPPFAILSALSLFYAAFRSNVWVGLLLQGMQAGVAAVIASVVWDMGSTVVKTRSWLSDGIMAAAFVATCCFHISVVYVVLACVALGAGRALWERKRGAQ